MRTATGTLRPRRRARLSIPLGVMPLAAVLAAGLAGSPAHRQPDQGLLDGYGGSATELALDTDSGSIALLTAQAAASFSISGSVHGLYPGLTRALVLTIVNHRSFAIDVTSITTKVGQATAACPPARLKVSAFAGNISVPARGTRKASVAVQLIQSASNGCIGVGFPLVYSGIAHKAGS